MRLETMIVGDVANRLLLARRALKAHQCALLFGNKRLFDQDVFAVTNQIVEDRDLGRIRDADQCRVEGIERYLEKIAERGVRMANIDRGNAVIPGDAPPLLPLDTEPNHDDA